MKEALTVGFETNQNPTARSSWTHPQQRKTVDGKLSASAASKIATDNALYIQYVEVLNRFISYGPVNILVQAMIDFWPDVERPKDAPRSVVVVPKDFFP